jgi:hypothetical protein
LPSPPSSIKNVAHSDGMRTDANDDLMGINVRIIRRERRRSVQFFTSGIVRIVELWIFTLLYLVGRYRSDGVTFAFIFKVEELSSKFDVY